MRAKFTRDDITTHMTALQPEPDRQLHLGHYGRCPLRCSRARQYRDVIPPMTVLRTAVRQPTTQAVLNVKPTWTPALALGANERVRFGVTASDARRRDGSRPFVTRTSFRACSANGPNGDGPNTALNTYGGVS